MKLLLSILSWLIAARLLAADPILPDPKLTPGDMLTNVTIEQLVQRGYANGSSVASAHRSKGARHVTEATKRKVFIEYFGRVPAHPGDYEIDHLVSLELDGSNDIRNLWPETRGPVAWNALAKDRLENRLAAMVREELQRHGPGAAEVLLRQYQRQIASNWIATYREIFGTQGKAP